MRDYAGAAVDEWRALGMDPAELSTLEVGLRLLRTATELRQTLERALPRIGLRSRTDYETLAVLRRAGRDLSVGEIAKHSNLSSGGATGRIDRFEEGGLVERSSAPDDRRGVVVRLTSDGVELVDQALALTVEIYEAALASISRAERRGLAELLKRISGALDDVSPGAE